MDELINRFLEGVSGPDLWIALIGSALVLLVWYWQGTKRTETRKRRQIKSAASGVILIIAVIMIRGGISSTQVEFQKDVVGILVMGIAGDKDGALQRDLMSSLNRKLDLELDAKRIQVRASADIVDEATGLDLAHERARKAGQKINATLTIWGNRVGENKFHPRITVARKGLPPYIKTDRTSQVMEVNQVELPAVLIGQPLSLAHFVAGWVLYHENRFVDALRHYELANQTNALLRN